MPLVTLVPLHKTTGCCTFSIIRSTGLKTKWFASCTRRVDGQQHDPSHEKSRSLEQNNSKLFHPSYSQRLKTCTRLSKACVTPLPTVEKDWVEDIASLDVSWCLEWPTLENCMDAPHKTRQINASMKRYHWARPCKSLGSHAFTFDFWKRHDFWSEVISSYLPRFDWFKDVQGTPLARVWKDPSFTHSRYGRQ